MTCPDGSSRLIIDPAEFLEKTGWKLQLDVLDIAGHHAHLSLAEGEIGRAAAGVKLLRESWGIVAESWNRCALSQTQYSQATQNLTRLAAAGPAIERASAALAAGKSADTRQLEAALRQVERSTRELARLSHLEPKLDWLARKVIEIGAELKRERTDQAELRRGVQELLEKDEKRAAWERKHPLATAEDVSREIAPILERLAALTAAEDERARKAGRENPEPGAPREEPAVAGEADRAIERQLRASADRALRIYAVGMDRYRNYRFREAAKEFESAIAIFPSSYFHAALGNAELALNDLGRAEKAFTEGIAAARAQQDPSQEAALTLLHGRALFEKGEFAAARKEEEEALKIDEHVNGPNSAAVAVDLSDIAQTLLRMNDLQGARSMFDRARQLNEHLHGQRSLEVAVNRSDFGQVLEGLGDAKGARDEYRAALDIEREKNAPDIEHRSSLASVLSALGQNLFNTRTDMKEGLKDLEEARALDLEIYGPEHQHVANDYASLCTAHAELGDLAKAEEECKTALATAERVLGEDHWETAAFLRMNASILQRRNRLADALPLLRRALAIHLAAVPTDGPQTQTDYDALGNLLRQMNRFDESLANLDCALRIAEASTDDLRKAQILNEIGTVLATSGACEQALFFYFKALAMVSAKTEPGQIDRAYHLFSVGLLLWQMGEPSAASFLEDSVAILQSHGDPYAGNAESQLRMVRSVPPQKRICRPGE